MKTFISFVAAMGFALQGYSTEPVSKASTGEITFGQPQQKQQEQKRVINRYDNKKRRHGEWEFYWDEDSTVVANKGEFKHGEQVGTWTYYNLDGSLQKIETKRFWGRRYKTQVFYANGKVQKEGYARLTKEKEYLNYYWYGNWKCYDEKGNYVKTEKYKKGELVE